MSRSLFRGLLFLAVAATILGVSACSKQKAADQTVAEVNGDSIRGSELREFLGMRGGGTPVAGLTVEQKRQALDRLIAGRLLNQDARAQGLDNTDEFRNAREGTEQTALVTALLRKEIDEKAGVSREEVEAEAKKMMSADNTLTDNAANVRAGRSLSQAKLHKVQEELIDRAQKEIPYTIHQETMDRIAKGDKVPDNASLATTAGDDIPYGVVKQELEKAGIELHGGETIGRAPELVDRMLKREITVRSLSAYAKKHGIEGSEWHRNTREDMDRSILIDLLLAKIREGKPSVSDAEVDAYYQGNPRMFTQHGKKVPLATVKEQLRGFLQNEKRKSVVNAYIEELRKKAKITVHEKALGEV